MRNAAPGLLTRLMITATCLLLCQWGSGPTLVRIAWIRVEISSASLSRLNKVSSKVRIFSYSTDSQDVPDPLMLTQLLFMHSSNPVCSHGHLSVDGSAWLHHRGRLDVDGRFSVPLYKLGFRWCCGKIWDDKAPFKLYIKLIKIMFNEEDNLCLSFTVKGNPDDYYNEDCLSILINSGAWNDDDCDNKRGYICKRRGTFHCPIHMLRNDI